MKNETKPQEKRRRPGPTPGEVYDGLAKIVEQLRRGIATSEEAGVPVAPAFGRALQLAVVVECQLLDAITETN